MLEFLESFLAEVVLSIAILCFMLAFRYRKGRKWKMLSFVFLVAISPFYLRWMDFLSSWLIPIWLLLTLVGFFILVKNIKISAYYLVLNPTKPSKKPIEKTKKKLSSKLKMFEGLTYFLFATILVSILSFSFHESLEILQVPLQLVGIIVLFAIAIFYFLSDKNSPNRKLRVSLITFLVSSYVIMTYAFLHLMLFLYVYLSINLVYSSICATVMLGAFLFLVEHALLLLKPSIISSERKRSLSETFLRYSMANTIISLILVLILSDTLLLYIMFLEQSIEMMIVWTFPFFGFISGFYMNALRNNLEFKMQIGLLERSKLEQELNRLVGTKTNNT